MFDPYQFLTSSTEGPMSTEIVTVPPGEYPAYISDLKAREVEKKDGSGVTHFLDIYWKIDDPAVAELTGRETSTVRQSMFLDIDEAGNLEMGKGKNVDLGRLREALGQNKPGPWSPGQLNGASATVLVSNRVYEGKTYADVDRVVGI